MIQKHLILIDEKSQKDTLSRIKTSLKNDGFDLIYTEINPLNYQKRNQSGEISFDEGRFQDYILGIEYFKFADVILCDYNLITDIINGYQVIKIIRELNYSKKKKIILYSAQIENIIGDILTLNNDFESQKKNLAGLIDSNIEFIKRDGYDVEVTKIIKKEPEFDFETELVKWFNAKKDDMFNNLFPKYHGKLFSSIALEIQENTPDSVLFRRELVEQMYAYISSINNV